MWWSIIVLLTTGIITDHNFLTSNNEIVTESVCWSAGAAMVCRRIQSTSNGIGVKMTAQRWQQIIRSWYVMMVQRTCIDSYRKPNNIWNLQIVMLHKMHYFKCSYIYHHRVLLDYKWGTEWIAWLSCSWLTMRLVTNVGSTTCLSATCPLFLCVPSPQGCTFFISWSA